MKMYTKTNKQYWTETKKNSQLKERQHNYHIHRPAEKCEAINNNMSNI